MECPYCKKDIFGFTGLQELQKFHKHLPKCSKNPERIPVVTVDGKLAKKKVYPSMMDALELRAKSGQ